ncbi:MAG: SURF1 family protein [Rhodospirillaceae bacterium]|nr:SURF1 family protein [Rhodospirillaceae bacterium]
MTLPAVLGSLALGAWQVQRLEWKTALIAERQAQRDAQPLQGLPTTFDRAKHEYRKVRLAGRFLHEKEMYLAARSFRGNPGYHVVTPFALTGDGTILVDRGWIPLDRKAPESRSYGQAPGETAVEGYLRVPPPQGWFVPDNEPAKNFWFWIDIPTMARHAGLAGVKPYFLEAGPAENRGGYPIGGQTRFELPNDHLHSAITWFSMAIIGVVIYLLYHRRRARELAEGKGQRPG